MSASPVLGQGATLYCSRSDDSTDAGIHLRGATPASSNTAIPASRKTAGSSPNGPQPSSSGSWPAPGKVAPWRLPRRTRRARGAGWSMAAARGTTGVLGGVQTLPAEEAAAAPRPLARCCRFPPERLAFLCFCFCFPRAARPMAVLLSHPTLGAPPNFLGSLVGEIHSGSRDPQGITSADRLSRVGQPTRGFRAPVSPPKTAPCGSRI